MPEAAAAEAAAEDVRDESTLPWTKRYKIPLRMCTFKLQIDRA